ncbi:MAG: hypothetical protein AAGG48_14440 [Planctomycetota bacterium]
MRQVFGLSAVLLAATIVAAATFTQPSPSEEMPRLSEHLPNLNEMSSGCVQEAQAYADALNNLQAAEIAADIAYIQYVNCLNGGGRASEDCGCE